MESVRQNLAEVQCREGIGQLKWRHGMIGRNR